MKCFRKNDFDVDMFRGSGAGGQHRNKTDSCVRITHKETGLNASCCESRSQHVNKEIAFKKLAYMLKEYYYPKSRKEAIPTDEIRSYKQPTNTVVDKTGIKTTYDEVEKNGLDSLIYERKLRLNGD